MSNTNSQLDKLRTELRQEANSDKIPVLQRYFKTGPGEYAEGDIFLGLTVPQQHKIAKKFKAISLEELQYLIQSKFHEERLTSLFILDEKFQKIKTQRKTFIDFYLKYKKYVNNWDLVDCSAEMLGEYVHDIQDISILEKLLLSKSLWDRRIAMIASFHFLKKNQSHVTLQFATTLLNDKEPLIHKATGWMLREMGKRNGEKLLLQFLDTHVTEMPTVMFSYATERLSIPKKKKYQQIRRNFRKLSKV